jgi:hypothetical protein
MRAAQLHSDIAQANPTQAYPRKEHGQTLSIVYLGAVGWIDDDEPRLHRAPLD